MHEKEYRKIIILRREPDDIQKEGNIMELLNVIKKDVEKG